MLQGAEVTLSSDLDLMVEGHILRSWGILLYLEWLPKKAWIKYLQKNCAVLNKVFWALFTFDESEWEEIRIRFREW